MTHVAPLHVPDGCSTAHAWERPYLCFFCRLKCDLQTRETARPFPVLRNFTRRTRSPILDSTIPRKAYEIRSHTQLAQGVRAILMNRDDGPWFHRPLRGPSSVPYFQQMYRGAPRSPPAPCGGVGLRGAPSAARRPAATYTISAAPRTADGPCGRGTRAARVARASTPQRQRWSHVVLCAVALVAVSQPGWGQTIPQSGASTLVLHMDASALAAGNVATWTDSTVGLSDWVGGHWLWGCAHGLAGRCDDAFCLSRSVVVRWQANANVGTATATKPVAVANARYTKSGLTFASGSYFTIPNQANLDRGAFFFLCHCASAHGRCIQCVHCQSQCCRAWKTTMCLCACVVWAVAVVSPTDQVPTQ